MASTYSTNLKIELIGTGDQSGTWGATTNTNLGTLLEQAIVGYATQAVTDSGVATVLTIPDGASSTGRNYVITLTGALTANRTVEVPAVNKPYTFFNNTTGGYAVTVKVSGQTGVTIANGKKAIVYTNTTDVIEVANAPVTEAGTQTLTNKTFSGATLFPGSGTWDSSGNVGVGTTSPGYKLDVGGGTSVQVARVNGASSGTGAGSALFLAQGGTSNVALGNYSAIMGGAYNADTLLYTGSGLNTRFNNGSSEFMRIDSSGNVGIGTASPLDKLNVSGSSSGGVGAVISVGNVANPAVGNESVIGFRSASVFATSYYSGKIRSIVTNASNFLSDLAFNVYDASGPNGKEAMRIDSSGNVGIGTTSPSNRLTISDTGSGLNRDLAIRNGDATNYHQLAIGYNAGALNTGVPQYSLFMLAEKGGGYGTVGGLSLGTVGAAPTIFINNGAETMRIDSSGNVGIGYTSISSGVKLDINGLMRATTWSLNGVGVTGGTAAFAAGTVSTDPNWGFYFRAPTSSSAIANYSFRNSSDTALMTIDSSGNVGIGTSSPDVNLSVFGSTAVAADVGGEISIGGFYNGSSKTSYASIAGVNQYGTGNTSGQLLFKTRTNFGSLIERMRIDTSGNVGIGTSAPAVRLAVHANNPTRGILSLIRNDGASALTGAQIQITQNTIEDWVIGQPAGVSAFAVWVGRNAATDGTECMRIDSSGNLLLGQTSWSWSNNGTEILSTGRIWNVSNTDYNLELAGSTTARMRFYTSAGGSGTTVGTITVTTSATAYNTSSDYRLKHSVASMASGLSTVSALKPVTYKWNVDDSDGEGFIAHELQAVIPLAVTGEKDAVDDEGNIVPQGVDYSKIVVHLVAALQELSAKNDALEARLAKLENV